MPSTGVTGRPDINPNSVPCDVVSRWPEGRFLAFHAAGPGRARFPDAADYIFALTPRKYV